MLVQNGAAPAKKIEVPAIAPVALPDRNGVLSVEVDGQTVAEVGPGAILGERAGIEGGHRTATLRTLTKAKVAVVRPNQLERDAREILGEGHRREELSRSSTSDGVNHSLKRILNVVSRNAAAFGVSKLLPAALLTHGHSETT